MGGTPFGDSDPGWPLRWIAYLGGALLGPVFITGSLVGLQNRKRAGLVSLIAMPFVAFCLAYPATGYLVWHSDGSGWFESPEPLVAIGLTIVFFLPIFAGLLALRRAKRSAYVLATSVVLAGIVFGLSHWTKAFLPPFGASSAIFLPFGMFWRATGKRNWPLLFRSRPLTLSHRAGVAVLICIVVLCVDVATTFFLSALGSSLFSGDCRGKSIFVRPESPYHAVFTARVIFAGRSIEARMQAGSIFRDPRFPESRDSNVGDWGIGVVQEKFWGLPSWSRFVLLTNNIYRKDTVYFLDGARGRGLLTRMLPIVDGRTGCSRTRPIAYATDELQALHQAFDPVVNTSNGSR